MKLLLLKIKGENCNIRDKKISYISGDNNLKILKEGILRKLIILAAFAVLFFLFGCSSGENTIQKAEEAITARDYDQAALYARQTRQSPEKQKARIILSYIKYGDNMLHSAFWEEDIEALQYLAGIIHDINKRDERFDAPVLVLAAGWGHADMVIILLEAGADPNYGTDKDGYTALMWAAKNFDEQLEMTRALLEAGAEVNVRSNYGETPLSIAEEYQNPNIVALLREYDAVE